MKGINYSQNYLIGSCILRKRTKRLSLTRKNKRLTKTGRKRNLRKLRSSSLLGRKKMKMNTLMTGMESAVKVKRRSERTMTMKMMMMSRVVV